jgi:hypothetical protein
VHCAFGASNDVLFNQNRFPSMKFCDTNLTGIEFIPSWNGKESSVRKQEQYIQTEQIAHLDIAIGPAPDRKTVGNQTTEYGQLEALYLERLKKALEVQDPHIPLPNHPHGLVEMLKRNEGPLSAMLLRNCTNDPLEKLSHSFQAQIKKKKQTSFIPSATLLFEYQAPPKLGRTSVLDISWNAKGHLLSVAYGCDQHENWCFHRGHIALWNVSANLRHTTNRALAIVETQVSSIGEHYPLNIQGFPIYICVHSNLLTIVSSVKICIHSNLLTILGLPC